MVCSVFTEQIGRMSDTESRGCVMKDCKASADIAALGYYTRLCPTGCSPLKVTRQQNASNVVSVRASRLSGAHWDTRETLFALLVHPVHCTSSPLLHLLLAFCQRIRTGQKRDDLFRIQQVLVTFE